MDLIFGIVALIISAFLCFLVYIFQEENEDILCSAVLGALIFAFSIVGINLISKYYNLTITPIDVYRGKTTLEITYRDSIAIDSTVVWKEEVK
jgi:vacuolar-type H+-ATPase subunit I/STV1